MGQNYRTSPYHAKGANLYDQALKVQRLMTMQEYK